MPSSKITIKTTILNKRRQNDYQLGSAGQVCHLFLSELSLQFRNVLNQTGEGKSTEGKLDSLLKLMSQLLEVANTCKASKERMPNCICQGWASKCLHNKRFSRREKTWNFVMMKINFKNLKTNPKKCPDHQAFSHF